MIQIGGVYKGRYLVKKLLSQGGMGTIYKAEDQRLGTMVAIKVVSGLDSALRGQFELEAQTMARLRHPHLARVLDYHSCYFDRTPTGWSTDASLVMDYIEGETIAKKIQQHGALPEKQVVDYALQLLDALSYCHGQGIIHRDIKPANVVVCDDETVVLVDFGLVKQVADLHTKTIRGRGTPAYTPLEQYAGSTEHTDCRSDIYSLGATMYHALTGKAPETAPARSAAVLGDSLIPVRVLASAVCDLTAEAVMRALSLCADDRFQSAKEMMPALTGPVIKTQVPAQTRKLPSIPQIPRRHIKDSQWREVTRHVLKVQGLTDNDIQGAFMRGVCKTGPSSSNWNWGLREAIQMLPDGENINRQVDIVLNKEHTWWKWASNGDVARMFLNIVGDEMQFVKEYLDGHLKTN